MRYLKIVVTLIVILSFAACQSSSHETAKHEEHMSAKLPSVGSFGKSISKDNAVDVSSLAEIIDQDTVQNIKVSGTIKEVCQHSGCWVTLEIPGGEEVMVNMKDEAFSVPKDASGKQIWIEGVAVRELIPVEMLKHYAEDAGKSQQEIDAITSPEWKYTLDADGVIIE